MSRDTLEKLLQDVGTFFEQFFGKSYTFPNCLLVRNNGYNGTRFFILQLLIEQLKIRIPTSHFCLVTIGIVGDRTRGLYQIGRITIATFSIILRIRNSSLSQQQYKEKEANHTEQFFVTARALVLFAL